MLTNHTVIESLVLSSDLANLSRVEGMIDEITTKYSLLDDVYGNMLISITEAFTNAVVHGNKMDGSKEVQIELLDTPDSLVYSIKDSGVGFDYSELPDPTLPENLEKETGRGIFLIENLADSLEFEDNGSRILISFTK